MKMPHPRSNEMESFSVLSGKKNTLSQLQWPKLSKIGRITAISFVRQKETDQAILIGKGVMKLAYKC